MRQSCNEKEPAGLQRSVLDEDAALTMAVNSVRSEGKLGRRWCELRIPCQNNASTGGRRHRNYGREEEAVSEWPSRAETREKTKEGRVYDSLPAINVPMLADGFA